MALLGSGALAMWWDVAPEQRDEFEDWHSHEHFPERMSVPGFLRGSRWVSDGQNSFFVLYELEAYETLTSAPYRERLNSPTPWSTKMMPHHRNMVRSQCRVLDSFGGGLGGSLLTVRLSPQAGREDDTRRALREILSRVPQQMGITGGHLLRTDTPQVAQTTEQKIRGGDAAADWIVILCGYDARAVLNLAADKLGSLADGARHDLFRLSYAATPGDFQADR